MKSNIKRKLFLGIAITLLAAFAGCTSRDTPAKDDKENAVTAGANEVSDGRSDNDDKKVELSKDIGDYHLNLPETYSFEIKVINDSEYGKTENIYALSEGDGWVYIKLGVDTEQYVYKPISEGKYIEYRYDVTRKKYVPTMISEPLQTQIDLGNVSLDSVSVQRIFIDGKISAMSTYLSGYETLTATLEYEDTENCAGVDCARFKGKVDTVVARSEFEYCIDPETGLVFRYKNTTKTVLVDVVTESEVVTFSTKANIPAIEE